MRPLSLLAGEVPSQPVMPSPFLCCSMDYIPSTSAIDTTRIIVDPDTKAMLEKLELTFPVQVKSAYRPRRRQEA